ncbi:hypothetical protein [Kordia sp.]|uniref:hypothetical protein n=1 Tax=Kordia sp. TaxID=1965332 RepID=UPI003B5BB514
MAENTQIETLKEHLLDAHVELEKLALIRNSIFKEAAICGVIAVACFVFGFYAESAEWTNFPVFPGAIFVGSVLLALGIRPLQNYKNQLATAEEKRKGLHELLKQENLDYKVDIRVTRDAKGEFDVKKSIKLVTNS